MVDWNKDVKLSDLFARGKANEDSPEAPDAPWTRITFDWPGGRNRSSQKTLICAGAPVGRAASKEG